MSTSQTDLDMAEMDLKAEKKLVFSYNFKTSSRKTYLAPKHLQWKTLLFYF